MKRILCLWLPNWPLQRLVVARPELSHQPIALHARDARRGERVVACSTAARRRGVRPGMTLSQAIALPSENAPVENATAKPKRERRATSVAVECAAAALHCEPYDPAADLAALERLAEECERFSPIVGVEQDTPRDETNRPRPPERLLMEITHVAKLFGGEAEMARQIDAWFRRRGHWVRIAVADTIGAAWGTAEGILPPGETLAALASRPTAALRLPAATIELLRELGIETVGQLLRLPRASLPSRFGDELLRRIDQADGSVDELIAARRPPAQFVAEWNLEHPTARRDSLDFVLSQLVERVGCLLASRGEGVLRLECWLETAPDEETTGGETTDGEMTNGRKRIGRKIDGRKIDGRKIDGDSFCNDDDRAGGGELDEGIGGPAALRLRADLFQPTADPQHLMELMRMQFESLVLPGAVERVRIEAVLTARLESRQLSLFGDAVEASGRSIGSLIDRLSARLGREAVLAPRLKADPQPELACDFTPLAGNEKNGDQRRSRRKRDNGQRDNGRHSSEQHSNGRNGRSARSHSARIARATDALGAECVSNRPGPSDRPLRLSATPLPLEVLAVAPDGPPVRLVERGRKRQVVRHWGPERIETGWWRGASVRRDYYRVETETGQRLWIFRRLTDGRWFLHGWFD